MTDVQSDPAPSTPAPSGRSRRKWWITLAVVALVAVAGAAVWYLVFRDTAPAEVDIDRAAAGLEERTGTDATASTTGGSSGASLDGTWEIDSSIGEFDVANDVFTSAFVGYRVNEELAGVGAKTAFGRTPDVTGSLTIEGTQVTAAEFTADLTTLQSDESRRDGQLRTQGIETAQFPTATFTLTQPIELGEIPADESTLTVDATGQLTLHGVTRSVTIPIEAKLVDDTIVVTSLFDIDFADYDITPPTSFAVLSIEDRGIMEVQLFFTMR